MTPLKRACTVGSRRIVAALLELGARRVGATPDPDERAFHDDEGMPELHLAARTGNPDIVRMLLLDGADPAETDRTGRTPLYWAAHYGRDETVRVLLTAGADPNAPSNRNLNPLRVAAFDGHTRCVTHLLKAGAEVDAATAGGVTALHLAALWQRRWVVPLLLQAGADPNRIDATGRTPLMWALKQPPRASRGERRTACILEDLLAAGADLWVTDANGETALFAAVRSHQPIAVRCLLAHGADANERSVAGLNPLHLATLQPEVIEALLVAGADVNCLDPDGASPLHRLLRARRTTWIPRYRRSFQHWEWRNLFVRLVAAGVVINQADYAGVTPLMIAAQIQEDDLTPWLLDAGADPTLRDQEGRTAQDYAAAAEEPLPDAPEPGYFHAVLRRFSEFLDIKDRPGAPRDFLEYLASKDRPPAW